MLNEPSRVVIVEQPPKKPNNFPPFTCIPHVQPCFYQNIDEEIVLEHRPTVTLAYQCVIGFAVYYIYQLIASVASWAVTHNLFGIIYFFLGVGEILVLVPVNYVLWFRPIYNSYSYGTSTLNYTFFFIISAITICWLVLLGIGIPGFTPGLVNGIMFLTVGQIGYLIAGILMMTSGLLAFALAGVQFLLFIRVRRSYHSSGASGATASTAEKGRSY